ncbi:hypothetical protein ADZ37_20015 [Pannonibacter phragmitetus]|uniref:HAD-IA family hydrolase n=1 Tax=Pannonibacter phragmitetus TaxID=121719 RepID=UPI00067CDB16|nr:HAD-IA family hydrolase [Pannonibacter phragmitetus]KND17146.1 hypothetical protein ADZ37_20015 [Pannonibacter phragmitetus]
MSGGRPGPAALIFDVDGTLAETEELHRAAFNAAFAAHGLGWHWDRTTYGGLLAVTGGKERIRAYRDRHALALPRDVDIVRLHADKTRRYGRMVAEGALRARPGVLSLLAEARVHGLRLAVATTTSPENIDALCRALWRRPAGEIFDVIAAGDEAGAKKPAPGVYLLALARLGIAGGAALAFEDSEAGVASACAAGLKVVACPSLYMSGGDFSGAWWVTPSLDGAWRHITASF